MGNPVTVRSAGPEDWATITELWQHAHATRRNGRPLPASQVAYAERRLGTEGSLLLVAEEPDEEGRSADLVGTILGLRGLADDGAGPPVPGLLHISMLSVAPDRWGRHVGRMLLEAMLAEAVRHGYDQAQLWTHADNLRANRLYKVMGFKRSGRARIDDWGELIVHYRRVITDDA